MRYGNVTKGIFLSRPNRFIAEVEVEGKTETCHVKNTGRCKELLVPGVTVVLEKSGNPQRKTAYDLVAVYKGKELFNIDSQAPNKVFGEWAKESGYFGELSLIKPETTFGKSRFDFYMESGERRIFAEVKGVTLEKDGVLMFPDAPTERGVKHIKELCEAVKQGFEAYVIFVVQTENALYFTPNRETHPEFAEALEVAEKRGVKIICLNCKVKPDELKINKFVEVRL